MKNNDKKFFKALSAAFAVAEDVKKQVELKIEGIDKKYRLLAEKEKYALVKTVESLSSQIAEYKKLLSQYTESTVEDSEQQENVTTQDTTVAEPSTDDNTTVEESEEVVDTIFPENNKSESSDETEDTAEAEMPEDNAEVESTTENDSWFEESAENNNSDNIEEGEPITDDGWPEVPEEWK